MPVIDAPKNKVPVGPIERRSGHRGQTLALFALFLVVLIGSAALTIDYASWLQARRDYQNGADAAALAGAQFLTRPIDTTKRTQARLASWTSLNSQLGLGMGISDLATLSGRDTPAVTPDVFANYRIWVSTPPIGLASTTRAKYPGMSIGSADNTVFVWVEKDNPSYFSGVFGQGSSVVSAWATAGSLPGRWAVITLRRNGQASTGNPDDIQLQGGSTLNVTNGDVGGNWGMAIGGNPLTTQIRLMSTSPDTYGVYLTEPVSGQTPGNGWLPYQVVDAGGAPVTVQYVPEVPDPNYPLPAAISNAPANAVSPSVPTGDFAGSVDVDNSAPGGTNVDSNGVPTSCDPASPKIGPGYYTSIRVGNGKCLILDPVNRYTGTIASETLVPGLPSGQLAGIFYVNGPINVDNGAMIIGNGVTIIMRPHPSNQNENLLTVAGGANSHGVVNLNQGRVLGAWMTRGGSPYTCTTLLSIDTCTYSSGLESDNANVGIALYVVKRIQYDASVASDNNSSIINVSASGGLSWKGVTYAPHDNVKLAGQPGHDAIGQLVSWTVKFDGGTAINQTYRGPEIGIPYLIEPRIGQ